MPDLGGPARPITPGHPALAFVAPHRVGQFLAAVGIGEGEPIEANFTGWSKLVLLGPEVVVMVPRNHTQVPPLRRELAALEVVAGLGIPGVAELRAVIEDPDLGPYPFVVCERLPGVPLADVIESVPAAALGDLFEDLGRRVARWHEVPVGGLPLVFERRDAVEPIERFLAGLDLSGSEQKAAQSALARARSLESVLVHGDLHEGQLLVGGDGPAITGILDWQTARIDHPFVDFDLGEWGTALWRAHRQSFPDLRQRAWAGYAEARGLSADLALVFEWFHATSHARRMIGPGEFPVQHQPGITGTADAALRSVRTALAAIGSPTSRPEPGLRPARS